MSIFNLLRAQNYCYPGILQTVGYFFYCFYCIFIWHFFCCTLRGLFHKKLTSESCTRTQVCDLLCEILLVLSLKQILTRLALLSFRSYFETRTRIIFRTIFAKIIIAAWSNNRISHATLSSGTINVLIIVQCFSFGTFY